MRSMPSTQTQIADLKRTIKELKAQVKILIRERSKKQCP